MNKKKIHQGKHIQRSAILFCHPEKHHYVVATQPLDSPPLHFFSSLAFSTTILSFKDNPGGMRSMVEQTRRCTRLSAFISGTPYYRHKCVP
jgi:hypothetical protein